MKCLRFKAIKYTFLFHKRGDVSIKKTAISVILIFAAIFAAKARINETEAECEKRYGTAVDVILNKKSGFLYKHYLKNDYVISVIFDKGNAIRISYCKLDVMNRFYQESVQGERWKDIVSCSRFMSDKLPQIIIDRLLQINSDGKKWTELIPGQIWSRSGNVEAAYDKADKRLSINSKKYLDFIKDNTGKELVGF